MSTTLYRLTDRSGRVLRVADTPEEAKETASEADYWKTVDGGYDGYCTTDSYFANGPAFEVRAVEA